MKLGTDVGRRCAYQATSVTGETHDELFERILAMCVGGSVFTAGYYAVDGGTGKVSDIIDWLDPTHTMHQGTGANQCAVPAGASATLGRQALTVTGSEQYDSSRADSAWKYLHDGTGCTQVVIHSPTNDDSASPRIVQGTIRRNDSTSTHGSVLYYTLSADQYTWIVGNGTVSRPVAATDTAATIADVPQMVAASYRESGLTPEYEVRRNGALTASGLSGGNPSSTNPTATLRFFASTTGAERYIGKWMASFFAPKVLNFRERQTVLEWAKTRGVMV